MLTPTRFFAQPQPQPSWAATKVPPAAWGVETMNQLIVCIYNIYNQLLSEVYVHKIDHLSEI